VQLNGNCNGVYVTNKTQYGFDVIELSGGQSNVHFQYQIIANVQDAKLENGRINKLADIRFQKVLPDPEMIEQKAIPVQTIQEKYQKINPDIQTEYKNRK